MGLDAYLFKKARTEKMKMLYKLEGVEDNKELTYWRKVYSINEFILGNFYDGDDDPNCKEILLSKEDFDMFIEFIREGGAESGEIYYSKEDTEVDLKILEEIKSNMDWDNEVLFYYAWW